MDDGVATLGPNMVTGCKGVFAGGDMVPSERLLDIAQEVIKQRWGHYEELATRNAADFHPDARREQES